MPLARIFAQLALSFILLLAMSSNSLAQKSKHLKLGHRFYKYRDYYTAISHYDRVEKLLAKGATLKGKTRYDYLYRYAESNRYTYNFIKAEALYAELIQAQQTKRYPNLALYHAYTLKLNGQYDKAAEQLKNFLEQNKLDPQERERAEQELKSCTLAKELIAQANLKTRIERLGNHINTKYSDFSPLEVGDEFYYATLRFERRPTKNRRIYYTKDVTKHLVGKIMYSKDVNASRGMPLNELNQKYNSTGNVTLSPDGQYLFFTVCTSEHPDRGMTCAIHYSRRAQNQGTTRWLPPVALPSPINLKDYTSTHPSIGYDSLLAKQVLFFISDRPGATGKTDLWQAVFESDTVLGPPQALGAVVNTKDEEATPFFHTPTQTLYFSSKWHPGLGGFDVFYTRRTGPAADAWAEPVNAGVPLNSAANDIYFVVNRDDSTGYFASNRVGSNVLTGESCCNDIYRINLPDLLKKPEPPLEPETPSIDTTTLAVVVPPVLPEPPSPPVVVPPNPPAPALPSPQERINKLQTLLPLALYFHDDQPDPNTMSKEASTSYGNIQQNYLDMKEEYLAQYKNQDATMQTSLDSFFENKIDANYRQLQYVCEELLQILQQGVKLELSLKGFSSARGAAKYNLFLAKRRIDAVKKELLEYQGGKLEAYLNSGQLIIKELPLGSIEARAVANRRDAIYSIEAAKDRRVQIQALELRN